MVASDSYEKDLWAQGHRYVTGVDESGVGSFAGEVTVAAVVFPIDIDYKTLIPSLNDSKTKSAEQRKKLYEKVKQHALCWSVATASVEEIDRLNIYWAKFLAARRAINDLIVEPDFVLMDGDKEIPEIHIPQMAIVKGDSKSITIAAASILAKVDRDTYMDTLAAKVHKDYDWAKNRAYYSKQHVEAIKKHGKTKWHRQKYVAKYLEK